MRQIWLDLTIVAVYTTPEYASSRSNHGKVVPLSIPHVNIIYGN